MPEAVFDASDSEMLVQSAHTLGENIDGLGKRHTQVTMRFMITKIASRRHQNTDVVTQIKTEAITVLGQGRDVAIPIKRAIRHDRNLEAHALQLPEEKNALIAEPASVILGDRQRIRREGTESRSLGKR